MGRAVSHSSRRRYSRVDTSGFVRTVCAFTKRNRKTKERRVRARVRMCCTCCDLAREEKLAILGRKKTDTTKMGKVCNKI